MTTVAPPCRPELEERHAGRVPYLLVRYSCAHVVRVPIYIDTADIPALRRTADQWHDAAMGHVTVREEAKHDANR